MATNERKFTLGLGNVEQIEQLDIRWPSGVEQSFEGVKVDQELLVVEGVSQLFPLPR